MTTDTRDPVAALLVDVIEQAIFETDTGLGAALLASERIPSSLAEQGYVLVNAKIIEGALELIGVPDDKEHRERFAETILAAIQEQATDDD
jgi:hypothetical protein